MTKYRDNIDDPREDIRE